MTDRSTEPRNIYHLAQPGGVDSGGFTIEASETSAWSRIIVEKTKADGTSLRLYSDSSPAPVAIARERKLSDRPGVAESTRAIAGVFEVVDEQGVALATLHKNALHSVLRTTWEIEFTDRSQATGRETNPLKVAVRRLLMLAELLIDIPIRLSSGFVFHRDGEVLFTVETASETSGAQTVSVFSPLDERIVLLQAALTRTR
ncbi:hypothetical protein PQI66_08770 [Corynebacterium sp. USCH3]|uniref:hypothetical protein n=1 Tax=Corynebacterium sp. USCH3 TaxID=3024840 RepID=UPI0030AC5267